MHPQLIDWLDVYITELHDITESLGILISFTVPWQVDPGRVPDLSDKLHVDESELNLLW